MLDEKTIRLLDKKKKLITYYYDNFFKYYQQKEYSKASEYLWGVLNNLVTSIGLFYNIKKFRHKEIVQFVKNILAIQYSKDEMISQMNAAETIHANFYHDFMNEDVFDENKNKILKLFQNLNEILNENIKQAIKR